MPARSTTSRAAALAAALATLALAPGAAAAPAPRLAAAYTRDADGDGRVDRVVVSFTKRVRGRVRAGDFRIRGHRVIRAGKPRGSRLVLSIAEASGCDIGGRPTVAYRGRGLRSGRRMVRRSTL